MRSGVSVILARCATSVGVASAVNRTGVQRGHPQDFLRFSGGKVEGVVEGSRPKWAGRPERRVSGTPGVRTPGVPLPQRAAQELMKRRMPTMGVQLAYWSTDCSTTP